MLIDLTFTISDVKNITDERIYRHVHPQDIRAFVFEKKINIPALMSNNNDGAVGLFVFRWQPLMRKALPSSFPWN